ncbi:GNAT family N-acetyltransferase [Paenibacillus alkaliterrae]|nr:GNAT family protein [Paenibacillus alkaliterrae]MCF2936826.1 GNAT family N-acetyltransferase [Paenibacillus alkaliterrae]
MKIVTDRLIIRDFIQEDWQTVHTYASNPLVARYMIWGPNTEDDTKKFIQRTIEMQGHNPRKDLELAVTLKDSGQLIGGCGIHVEGTNGEIGYCFHPNYWRQGYASESAAALLKFGFNELGLHRIFATCRPDNIGSSMVMEKIGMKREGHLREHMKVKGQWKDSFLYSILDQEFRSSLI